MKNNTPAAKLACTVFCAYPQQNCDLLNPTVYFSRYRSLTGSDKESSRWHCDDGTTGWGLWVEDGPTGQEDSLVGVITKLGAEFAAQRVC